MNQSTCLFCSRPFRARRNKIYCSDRCRWAAWNNKVPITPIPCFYCGLPADSKDHVPPISTRTFLLAQGWIPALHFHEIDSCRECNAMLASGPPYTPIERKRKIKLLLARRYRKYLKMPAWRESEIRAVSEETFQIRLALAVKEMVLKRLEW